MSNKKAIIIGAGLTGLSTAFYLKKEGWQVTILERSDRAGGSIMTHREKGFIFESGPNTGIISHPDVADLLSNLSPHIEVEPLGESVRRRLVWKDCRWYALPHCLKDSLRTPLFKWNEKLKLLMGSIKNHQYIAEQFNPKSTPQPDFTVDPFIHAIYSGDFQGLFNKPNQTQPVRKDHGRASRLRNDKHHTRIERQLFFINGGLDNLVKAMVKTIGEESFRYNASDIKIYPATQGYTVSFNQNGQNHSEETPAVISTVGAKEVANIFPFLNMKEKNLLSELSYIHVVQVVVGFNKWRGIPLRAFGGLVPNTENRNILGILFPSSFLKGRSPEKGALLSIFLGGIHAPNLVNESDETIKNLVMQELRCMLLTPDEEPDLFRIFRHHYAFPQYDEAPQQRLDTIAALEQQFPGLILAGNMRDGVGMAHRIGQGAAIARELENQRLALS